MAAERLEMEGKWEQARGRVTEAWGVLADDELDRTEGTWDRLVGLIKERSGETASEVEGKLRDISTRSDGCEKMLRMTDR